MIDKVFSKIDIEDARVAIVLGEGKRTDKTILWHICLTGLYLPCDSLERLYSSGNKGYKLHV